MSAPPERPSSASCLGAYVSLSADVLPQIKEFERVSTTVVNAYVGPVLARYLERLERRLVGAGYRGPTLIIQSHGGVAPIGEAGRLAAGAVLSGPAGGVAGSVHAARLAGAADLIPFDMGGTSTDISLIVAGRPSLAAGRRVAGHAIALNSLDIASIGAGGGSIARVDKGGILHVGPHSAGAVPGPACYGNGGAEATVTDANLVLGYLDPASFLGGRRRLDRAAAEAVVDQIAAALGSGRLVAAQGIHRIVNTNMAEGVRLVSVRRGVDPRHFAILAFGGASGLHATEIARQLDLARVIVPRVAAVLSAWGMLTTDLRFEVARTHIGDTRALDGAAIKRLFDEMEAEGLARLRASFDGPARTTRSVDMRYGEQVFEIAVPLDDFDWAAPDPLPQIVERFHRRHEELYTYSIARPGDGPRQRPGRRLRHPFGVAAGAPSARGAANPAPCRAANLARRVGRRTCLRFRRALPGANDRRPGDCRIGDDDCPAAPGRSRHRDPARLARYRRLAPTLKSLILRLRALSHCYAVLRRRRINPSPRRPEDSSVSEAGSGTAETFSVMGVIVPVNDPALTNVRPVTNAEVSAGSRLAEGSIPVTVNSETSAVPKEMLGASVQNNVGRPVRQIEDASPHIRQKHRSKVRITCSGIVFVADRDGRIDKSDRAWPDLADIKVIDAGGTTDHRKIDNGRRRPSQLRGEIEERVGPIFKVGLGSSRISTPRGYYLKAYRIFISYHESFPRT